MLDESISSFSIMKEEKMKSFTSSFVGKNIIQSELDLYKAEKLKL